MSRLPIVADQAGGYDQPREAAERVLQAYLLGTVDWDTLLLLQRRLIYEVTDTPSTTAVILCEHPPSLTIGREGSREHVRLDWAELQRRGWPVRWHARGGGVMLHLPGQLACYPLVVLEQWGWTPAAYVQRLQSCLITFLHSYGLTATADPCRPGVRIGQRRIAHIGVAVRYGVTCFGAVLNVDPDLRLFHRVHCDGDEQPMTSLQREIGSRFRVSGVRQRLLELLQQELQIERLSIFHTPPDLMSRVRNHATASRSR
ncbi:MAG: hypothetical protein NZ703_00445 [Gemmataceae bacterium]|nr:hypothetical protein [Gemmataceae bacterium]